MRCSPEPRAGRPRRRALPAGQQTFRAPVQTLADAEEFPPAGRPARCGPWAPVVARPLRVVSRRAHRICVGPIRREPAWPGSVHRGCARKSARVPWSVRSPMVRTDRIGPIGRVVSATPGCGAPGDAWVSGLLPTHLIHQLGCRWVGEGRSASWTWRRRTRSCRPPGWARWRRAGRSGSPARSAIGGGRARRAEPPFELARTARSNRYLSALERRRVATLRGQELIDQRPPQGRSALGDRRFQQPRL